MGKSIVLKIYQNGGQNMNFDERLTTVSVIGAAGKMGSGIALLMAQEMAMQKLKPENADKIYRLYLIDMNDTGLDGLIKYLKAQSLKTAEKTTVMLRDLYADREDLVENAEIINQYVEDVMTIIRVGTDLNLAAESNLVFEAIIENIESKISLFKQLNELCSKDTYFFTNTSSIPIHLLNNSAKLDGRIIGFHFYNPPAVQKLAELIPAKNTRNELKEISFELGKRLRKKIFLSADVAGFIGNGHFLRDALHATHKVKRLSKEFTQHEAIYIIDRVSRDLLLRPMGIFQLMDYVGIDVMYFISKIMDNHIDGENLSDELIDTMYNKKVLGGQRADGSQKDGFFKYAKNRPIGVYNLQKGEYELFDEKGWTSELDKKMGDYPEEWAPWKKLVGATTTTDKLKIYFKNLVASNSFGAELAKAYLKRSKQIGQQLVDQGVAGSAEDVNGVLLNGFYHLYGPINEYI